MKTKLFNNLLLKVLSIVAAVVLWLIVVNIDDPVVDRPIKDVKVNLINTEAITAHNQTYRIVEGTDRVDLKVYARRSIVNKLKVSDFEVTADMQKDLAYGSMVKIEVNYTGNFTLDHIEQNRENTLVSIEESVTEQFKVSVDTKGSPSDGLVKGSAVPEQTLVEITGPVSVVRRIKKVEASVNIMGITGTTVKSCRLKLYDSDGNEIDGTYLNYVGKDTDFDVTVTTLNKKLVGISFDISQAAPEGYGINAFSYKPETVTIAGLKTQITPIYNLNIPKEALNPEGRTGKVEMTVDISQYLPEGILIPEADEREIVVTMEILPHDTANILVLPGQIHYANIQEGLELDMTENAGLEIPVSGMSETISALKAEDLAVSVDLSECVQPGDYTVPVTIMVPEGCTCPEDMELAVRLRDASEDE